VKCEFSATFEKNLEPLGGIGGIFCFYYNWKYHRLLEKIKKKHKVRKMSYLFKYVY
jgi:hypothetical protein